MVQVNVEAVNEPAFLKKLDTTYDGKIMKMWYESVIKNEVKEPNKDQKLMNHRKGIIDQLNSGKGATEILNWYRTTSGSVWKEDVNKFMENWFVMPQTIVDKVDDLVKKGKVKESDRNYLLEAVKATYQSYVTDGMAEDKAAEKMLGELKNTEERKEMVAVQKKEALKQKTPKPTEKPLSDAELGKIAKEWCTKNKDKIIEGAETQIIIDAAKAQKSKNKKEAEEWLEANFLKPKALEEKKPPVKEATIQEMLDKKDAQNTVVGSPVDKVAEKVTVKDEKEALIKALTELSEVITALTTSAKEAHPEEVSNRPLYTYVPIVGELAQLIFPSEGAKWYHKVPVVGWFMNIFSPPKAKDQEFETKRIAYVNERLPESVLLTLDGKEQNVNFYLDPQKTVMMRTTT